MSLKENKIYIVVFTFIYSFVFILILALVNGFTLDIIKKNAEVFKQKAILLAMDVTVDNDADILALYEQQGIVSTFIDGTEVCSSIVDGNPILAVSFSGNGLWGTIRGFLAVDDNLERIRGLAIVEHNETPGLGGRIEEEWFLEQFRGELVTGGTVKVTTGAGGNGNYNSEDGAVDAITGATRTSEYLQVIIEDTLAGIRKLREGGRI
jgi:Na+-transporting NADH:ubiquinone oxidoreductase subunit C